MGRNGKKGSKNAFKKKECDVPDRENIISREKPDDDIIYIKSTKAYLLLAWPREFSPETNTFFFFLCGSKGRSLGLDSSFSRGDFSRTHIQRLEIEAEDCGALHRSTCRLLFNKHPKRVLNLNGFVTIGFISCDGFDITLSKTPEFCLRWFQSRNTTGGSTRGFSGLYRPHEYFRFSRAENKN